MKTVASLVIVALASGCFYGATRSGRRLAYTLDGTALISGAAIAAAGYYRSSKYGDDALPASVLLELGGEAICVAAVLGLLINAATAETPSSR